MIRLDGCVEERVEGSCYPHEACGTSTEYPILLHYRAFSPRGCSTATCVASARGGGGSALDVVVESLDYVARARFFEVGGFVAKYLVFQRRLSGSC